MSCRKLRICFVAPFAYPVFAGLRNIASAGGAEVQQSFLARELARRGHEVSLVSMDFGQAEGEVIDGVRQLRMHAPAAGLPVLRFLHPRLTSVWSAMKRADADIYYQRAGAALTGFVGEFAHRHGRRFVFAAASDLDFDPTLPLIPLARDRWLYRRGLSRSHHVVAQSLRQQGACGQWPGKRSTLIGSCHAGGGPPANPDGPVLWVGTVKALKRPELFVALARSLPHRRFRMVGGGSAKDMAALRGLAAGVPNLELLGFVPYVDVERQFDGAALLVNTSQAEGFPNTFLQAWARGMPTVSFFDPGSRHAGQPVGLVTTTPQDMAAAVSGLCSDQVLWREYAERCHAHYLQHHTVDKACLAYETVFEQALDTDHVSVHQQVRA